MADKLVALSNIEHGQPDGTIIKIAYGESVDALPKDAIKQLQAVGVVGPEPMAASEAVNEIEELKRQLAEAKALLEAKEAYAAKEAEVEAPKTGVQS